jgi:archaellum component FlaF (FlaF/FlaG flagellin family)
MIDINKLNLNKFKVKHDYFKSAYTNVFDAIAQLVDNARDADAKNLIISSYKSREQTPRTLLCFADDGSGMSLEQIKSFLILTHGTQKNPQKIGI